MGAAHNEDTAPVPEVLEDGLAIERKIKVKKLTPRQINAQRKKDGKPPLNFPLLRRLIKKLETNPESYNQGVWGIKNPTAPCGTAACIAGWTAFLDKKLTLKQLWRNPKRAGKVAARSLGLHVNTWDYVDEKTILFNGWPADIWPSPYGDQYAKARTEKQRARVAVRYLKHIIATGEIGRQSQ